MKTVIQRVNFATIKVDGKVIASIQKGLLVFVGIGHQDTEGNSQFIIDKVLNLRIFEDGSGKMNLSLKDIDGDLLLVSQFTLYGNCIKGRRPSFGDAAPPDQAKKLYDYMVEKAQSIHPKTQTGQFAADMKITLENDGPVTIKLDSPPLKEAESLT
jgi:D-aminoacyl-tRNA deacylase